MNAVVATVRSVIGWFWDQLVAFLTLAWAAMVALVDQLAAWIVGGVGWVVEGLAFVVFGVLGVVVGFFLDMPVFPESAAFNVSEYLGLANRYLPITEAMAMAAVWAAVYGGIFLYKGGKFVRGGG
jgi:hypothetical protein